MQLKLGLVASQSHMLDLFIPCTSTTHICRVLHRPGFQPRLGDAYRWLIALMTVLESSILMNTQVVHRVMLHVPPVVRVAVEPAYVIPATVHPTATYALIESVKIALITPMDHAQAPCVPQVDLPRRPAARALAESVPYELIQMSHVRDVIQIALRAT